MPKNTDNKIIEIIRDRGPVNARQIQSILQSEYNAELDIEEINSALYGSLHNLLVRDKNELGYPVWRIKGNSFEAAMGLEVMFYEGLLKQKIVTENNSQLDFMLNNPRNNKTYHLDIAVFKDGQRFNIEIDGFEHIRADARLSIQRQIEVRREESEIEIDWMDNETSYADFKIIDSSMVFKWLVKHRLWCMKYHEELIKPHDITRNIWLIENGWRIIRFWNFEIKDDMNRSIKDVREFLLK